MGAYNIAVIGGGKMGEAILSGWIGSSQPPADGITSDDVIVAEPGEERRAYLSKAHGVTCVADASGIQRADIVVLAVKPQVMFDVLRVVSEAPAFQGGADGPLFISIAAGLPTARIEEALPAGARLVRVMPNMPLSICAGASGVCGGACAERTSVDLVSSLFGCLGRAVVVDESEMDVVCALSGSGPAYVAAMVEALRDAAVRHGLEADLAETLALQTVLGTARLMDESELTIAETRESICSPGGTTIAALDAMYAAGFDDVFAAGVDAAVVRSKELAQCS